MKVDFVGSPIKNITYVVFQHVINQIGHFNLWVFVSLSYTKHYI